MTTVPPKRRYSQAMLRRHMSAVCGHGTTYHYEGPWPHTARRIGGQIVVSWPYQDREVSQGFRGRTAAADFLWQRLNGRM